MPLHRTGSRLLVSSIKKAILYYIGSSARSLGVLLYTLVYGAMPFDGSNFKRLVKQITTGDYYEPKQPSSRNAYIVQSPNVFFIFPLNLQARPP